MKTLITILFILITVLLLSSCSINKAAPAGPAEITLDTAEAVDQPTREAVFVYNNSGKLSRRLTLKLAGEPVLFPSGYVRLVGVVSGGRPIACVEIGGRGLALGKGETVNDYRILGIDSDRVILERK